MHFRLQTVLLVLHHVLQRAAGLVHSVQQEHHSLKSQHRTPVIFATFVANELTSWRGCLQMDYSFTETVSSALTATAN